MRGLCRKQWTLFCFQCVDVVVSIRCVPQRVLCCSQGTGYGKIVSHVIIGLKPVKANKQLKLDPTIYDSLQKEKVAIGDGIYI